MHSIPVFLIGSILMLIVGSFLSEPANTKEDRYAKWFFTTLMIVMSAYLMYHGASK